MSDQNDTQHPANTAFAHLAQAAESITGALGLHIATGALDQAVPLVKALGSALDALLGIAIYTPPPVDVPVSVATATEPVPGPAPELPSVTAILPDGSHLTMTPAPTEPMSGPVSVPDPVPAPTPAPALADPSPAATTPASAMPEPTVNPAATEGLDPAPTSTA